MREEEPTLASSDNLMGDRFEHPAYGQIRCGRRQGHARLVGSELVHQHYVTLEICRAHKYRSLHEDRFMGGVTPLVEVNLSEHQWASFVASMNMGSGVPCTITYGPPDGAKGEQKPGIVEPNKHDLAKRELSEYAKETRRVIRDGLGKLEQLISAPGSISKTVIRDAVRSLKIDLENFSSNICFHVEQHQEMMEKNVHAAKSDVEGYITATAATLGLEVLRKMAPQLEGNGEVLALEDQS